MLWYLNQDQLIPGPNVVSHIENNQVHLVLRQPILERMRSGQTLRAVVVNAYGNATTTGSIYVDG